MLKLVMVVIFIPADIASLILVLAIPTTDNIGTATRCASQLIQLSNGKPFTKADGQQSTKAGALIGAREAFVPNEADMDGNN